MAVLWGAKGPWGQAPSSGNPKRDPTPKIKLKRNRRRTIECTLCFSFIRARTQRPGSVGVNQPQNVETWKNSSKIGLVHRKKSGNLRKVEGYLMLAQQLEERIVKGPMYEL